MAPTRRKQNWCALKGPKRTLQNKPSFSSGNAQALTAQRICSTNSSARYVARLMQINVYQEQSYLLDPYLEKLIGPPAQGLQEYVVQQGTAAERGRLWRYCRLLYIYTKVRGYKLVCAYRV